MEDNGNANDEIARLRAVLACVSESGARPVEITLGKDSLHLRLAPQAPAPAGNGRSVDPDEKSELDAEERELASKSEEEQKHYRFWKRVTRSSGAPIPPYVAKGTQ